MTIIGMWVALVGFVIFLAGLWVERKRERGSDERGAQVGATLSYVGAALLVVGVLIMGIFEFARTHP